MRGAPSIAGLLTVFLAVEPAMASDCPLARAVYEADQGPYRISFRPITEKNAAVTHRFALTDGKLSLDGLVMDTDEPLRTGARIEKDCPDGDVTGEDIRACTGFEGYVYAIDGKGAVTNLGPGETPAAERILFAGLGPALASSNLAAKWSLAITSDTYRFARCAP